MSYRNFRSFSNHFFSALLWKCVTGCCLSVQIHFFPDTNNNIMFFFASDTSGSQNVMRAAVI